MAYNDQSLNRLLDMVEPIIQNIIIRVARSSLRDSQNLGSASKELYANFHTRKVLEAISLDEVPFYHCFKSREELENMIFYRTTFFNGNGEALYRKGLLNFFDPKRVRYRDEGLYDLTRAADKRIPKENYALGMILICKGGERLTEGYERLLSLMKSSMLETIDDVVHMTRKLWGIMLWRCSMQTRALLEGFVHGLCECVNNGDDTLLFLKTANIWDNELENDVGDGHGHICQVFFWYREVVYLFSSNVHHFDKRL